MSATTPPLKGLRPPLSAPLSPRPALLKRLGDAARWFLTGPAGTGKTALAQLWWEKQSRKLPAIWLDLAVFPNAQHLSDACRSSLGIENHAHTPPDSWPEAALVVDHLEQASPVHLEQLAGLLGTLPAQWKVLLISRAGPPKASWILRFDLRVLGGDAFWWEDDELSHWLREQGGLSRQESHEAARWLSGWIGPAALYLRSLQAGQARARVWVHQFLKEEIIDSWPEPTRTLAHRLAWLPALESPWLEAMPLSDAEKRMLPGVLEILAALLTDGPYGRQFHPLLNEVLTGPEQPDAARTGWLETLDEALVTLDQPLARCSYLCKRQDWDRLEHELACHGQQFLKQGYHLHVLTFLDALPELRGRTEDLTRLRLWALFYADRRADLAREIRRLRAREGQVALPEDELTLLDMMTRSPKELGRGEAARDALERLRHQTVPVRSVAFFGLATAYYWQGALEESETLCLDALTHAKLEGRYSTVLSASGLLLWLHSIRGEAIRARNLLKDTDIWLEDFHSGGQVPHLVSCWRNSARVRLHALQGDLQLAWHALASMKRYISGAEPGHQAMTWYAEAVWHLHSQQADMALSCLDEAQDIASRHGRRFTVPAPPVEALRIKCLLQLGRLREALDQLRKHRMPTTAHPLDQLEWLEARCLLSLFDGQRSAALDLAIQLADQARMHRFLAHHITARAVQACLTDEPSERLESVRQCVEMAATNDLVFPLVQFRPFIREELSAMADDALLGQVASQLLAYDLSRPASEKRSGAQPLSADTLSKRELEVLGLVADGLANKEIAARLHLAGATVKAHIRNIYSKIGARNRTEAVRIARDSGLISTEK